ncbi:hypothetical protein C8J57DRAFT_1243393 [Mycena rebaudengoi]|nr:hypothetical protein C8J57DRAFT_1243393 [Mycena rebaudengoi]
MSDVQLVARIEALLRSCDSGFLSMGLRERRRITCLKALRASPILVKNLGLPLNSLLWIAYVQSTLKLFDTTLYQLVPWANFWSLRIRRVRILEKYRDPGP